MKIAITIGDPAGIINEDMFKIIGSPRAFAVRQVKFTVNTL